MTDRELLILSRLASHPDQVVNHDTQTFCQCRTCGFVEGALRKVDEAGRRELGIARRVYELRWGAVEWALVRGALLRLPAFGKQYRMNVDKLIAQIDELLMGGL